MILALTLCLVLLPAMGFSFRPVFRRLNKADLIFSSLSFCIGKCFPGARGAPPYLSISPLSSFWLCVSQSFCPAGCLSLNASWALRPTLPVCFSVLYPSQSG